MRSLSTHAGSSRIILQAFSTPLSKMGKRIHPLYPVVRIAYKFEKKFGRPAALADLKELQVRIMKHTLCMIDRPVFMWMLIMSTILILFLEHICRPSRPL